MNLARSSILPLLWLQTATGLAQKPVAVDHPPPPRFAPVRRIVLEGIRDGLAPSVAVGVVEKGHLVWAEGFGWADIENERRATSHSIYRLASISKPITATGLMLLVERGDVDLDAPANRYLPGVKLRAYRGDPSEMTLRRLLNHTSGLPLHYNFFYDGIAPPPMNETLRRYGFAATRPGTATQYSNLAFGILSHITELVAGEPWNAFLTRELYDKIGMTHTSAGIREGREADATAQYMRGAGGKWTRVGAYDFDHPGASALWASVRDLLRFARLHHDDGVVDGTRVLARETVQAMQRGHPDRPRGNKFGIAWMLGKVRGQRVLYHSGGMPGVAAFLRIFPDQRTVTAVLTNTSNRTMYRRVTDALTAVLVPEPQPAAAEPAAATNAPGARRPAAGTVTGIWSGKLAHWSDGVIPVRLEVRPGAAHLGLAGRAPQALVNVTVRAHGFWGVRRNVLLRTQDGFHGRPDLDFQLRLEEDRLVGVCVARCNHYFALSHWVELERQADATPAETVPFDLVIRRGRIVDGTGAPWFVGDIGIRDGRIARVGALPGADARREIDAKGLVVAPGFVDMMGQTASPFLRDRDAGLNLLSQGVTTILTGEGSSAAPLRGAAAERAGWSTMAEYFAELERRGLPLNVVQTVGHTQVRRLVIGEVDRQATKGELEQMEGLVREAMDAGAIGLSTALIYPPAVYASTGEIAALAAIAGARGGRYYTHMRNEGDRLLDAIEEALQIGRTAHTPVHIFHLKAAGRSNWGSMQQAISKIRAARDGGLEVDADVYPYVHNGLSLRSFIHPRHSAEGTAGLLTRLGDRTVRDEIRRELEVGEGWENWYRHAGHDWGNVVLGRIGAASHANHAGKSLAAIAALAGRDAWQVFFDLVTAGGNFAMPRTMLEANKIRAMQAEFVSFCTDVGPAGGSRIASHPRGWGSFPRVLARYVRELGVLTLEQAIAKMSALACNQCLVHDRGRIAEGLAADLVVFDFGAIEDRATFGAPDRRSEGVRCVIVNGQVVLENGRPTGATPGRVLRGPGFRR